MKGKKIIMDKERKAPFFPPSALKPAPPADRLALLSGLPPPPHPQQDNRTDGRMDGRTVLAPTQPRAGRAGGGRGAWGSAAGCPLPTAQPGGGGASFWGLFLVFFFVLSFPSPSARSPGVFVSPDGCRRVFGRADPHQALAAPPAGLGGAPRTRLPTGHSTLGPAPPTRPGHRSREERRGLLPAGYPSPVAPRFARRPPPRPWRRRRVLSPPGQKQRDSSNIDFFYFINFHFFLHKTSNCKYF